MARPGTKKRPIGPPIPYYEGRVGADGSAHTKHRPMREISRGDGRVLLGCPDCTKTEVIEH